MQVDGDQLYLRFLKQQETVLVHHGLCPLQQLSRHGLKLLIHYGRQKKVPELLNSSTPKNVNKINK